jgi:hypothetical protein
MGAGARKDFIEKELSSNPLGIFLKAAKPQRSI